MPPSCGRSRSYSAPQVVGHAGGGLVALRPAPRPARRRSRPRPRPAAAVEPLGLGVERARARPSSSASSASTGSVCSMISSSSSSSWPMRRRSEAISSCRACSSVGAGDRARVELLVGLVGRARLERWRSRPRGAAGCGPARRAGSSTVGGSRVDGRDRLSAAASQLGPLGQRRPTRCVQLVDARCRGPGRPGAARTAHQSAPSGRARPRRSPAGRDPPPLTGSGPVVGPVAGTGVGPVGWRGRGIPARAAARRSAARGRSTPGRRRRAWPPAGPWVGRRERRGPGGLACQAVMKSPQICGRVGAAGDPRPAEA